MKLINLLTLVPAVLGVDRHRWNYDYMPRKAMHWCPEGTVLPHIINKYGSVYRIKSDKTEKLVTPMGSCKSLSCIGPSCWGIDDNEKIYYQDKGYSVWHASNGRAVQIDVGEDWVPWVVNSSNNLYRRTEDNDWDKMSQKAKSVAVINRNRAWIIRDDGSVLYFNNGWVHANGVSNAKKIAVAKSRSDFRPYILTHDGRVWKKNCSDQSDCGWKRYNRIHDVTDITVKCSIVYISRTISGWNHQLHWVDENDEYDKSWTRMKYTPVGLG